MKWIRISSAPRPAPGRSSTATAGSTTSVVRSHPRRQLHRRLLVEHLRQGRHRHLGDAGARLPRLDPTIPPYEPRGCQRGISFSWYLYSPIRVKYPYVRGALLDIWREAPREARRPRRRVESRSRTTPSCASATSARAARAASAARSWTRRSRSAPPPTSTRSQKYGPDRDRRLLADPGDVQLSYAAGARMLQLMGGVNLSFYDWYCDLPPASPEIWGEQTDVAESADWYHSKMIAVMGANLNMTRTPDCHFIAEARQNGIQARGLLARLHPGQQVRRPVGRDQRGAGRRVLDGGRRTCMLKEFYVDKQTPAFEKLREAIHGRAVPGGARRDLARVPRRTAACAPEAARALRRPRRTASGSSSFSTKTAGEARMPGGTRRPPLGQAKRASGT